MFFNTGLHTGNKYRAYGCMKAMIIIQKNNAQALSPSKQAYTWAINIPHVPSHLMTASDKIGLYFFCLPSTLTILHLTFKSSTWRRHCKCGKQTILTLHTLYKDLSGQWTINLWRDFVQYLLRSSSDRLRSIRNCMKFQCGFVVCTQCF